jgi:hypothetical protein
MPVGQSEASSLLHSPAPFWWEGELGQLRDAYRSASPFPHVVIDNFLDPEVCTRIIEEEYGDVGSARWTYHRHYSQKTYSRTDASTYGAAALSVIEQLGSPRFLRFLQLLTGIDALFLDPSLEDGGLTASGRGGFANIHTDITVHPHNHRWWRRVNLLLYLNAQWEPSYKGELELWDRDVRHCVRSVAPLFNRCLIFEVSNGALHGYPEIIQCPADNPRKCFALYYFTEEATPPKLRYFDYHARPGEGLKHLWVGIDNLLIHTYERLRKPLGLNDRLVNRVMRRLRIG